ncbi:SDR family oxidoreductase [Paenibacillus sp. UMB4589-SE434]|uniref:SDR family NAD(P)-dependent oxidoreductase n=1 Tax=Paenibacillus sp. UMB4589-SE434 TaxID=3046314 RepID=UPI00254D4AE0|nr:SDR family oxidoreductase [Paenibacillus sp. UMB4589-SE434]MDK8183985.1 SDR family oxidoreductase [Paenibacillus sp. UMB4589-SE434]
MDIKGSVVVITGASSGIGALTAQLVAEAGAIPVLAARSTDKLAQVSARIQGQHECVQLDVTNAEEVEHVMARIIETYGRIDILLNNAGFGLFERATDLTLGQFEAMMDVNYMGTVRCTKAVLPSMLERRSGRIVNVASMAGKIGSPKSSAYSASKHAVLGFTNSLRMELAGTGVTVSAVNPGPIDTPFFDVADPTGHYVNNIKWFMMPPERVAKRILRVMERGTSEVDLPWLAAAGTKFMQLFPRISNRVAGRMLNKK